MTEREERTEDGPGERTPENRGNRMRDVSHTPPHGHGANRVWDGTRVYDRDVAGAAAPRDGDDAAAPRDGDDRAASRGDRATVREGDDE